MESSLFVTKNGGLTLHGKTRRFYVFFPMGLFVFVKSTQVNLSFKEARFKERILHFSWFEKPFNKHEDRRWTERSPKVTNVRVKAILQLFYDFKLPGLNEKPQKVPHAVSHSSNMEA